jgi:hypothetical protein
MDRLHPFAMIIAKDVKHKGVCLGRCSYSSAPLRLRLAALDATTAATAIATARAACRSDRGLRVALEAQGGACSSVSHEATQMLQAHISSENEGEADDHCQLSETADRHGASPLSLSVRVHCKQSSAHSKNTCDHCS